MLSLLYYLDFSFKSCNVYAVIPSSDYCTLQLCQAATWHSEASFHVRPKLNKWTSAWWDNFVRVTVIEEEWQENFRMSQTLLCKLADELRMNLDKCGRANWIWIRYMWTWKFLNPHRKFCAFKNIQICVDGTLYKDHCLQMNSHNL